MKRIYCTLRPRNTSSRHTRFINLASIYQFCAPWTRNHLRGNERKWNFRVKGAHEQEEKRIADDIFCDYIGSLIVVVDISHNYVSIKSRTPFFPPIFFLLYHTYMAGNEITDARVTISAPNPTLWYVYSRSACTESSRGIWQFVPEIVFAFVMSQNLWQRS